MRSRIDDPGNQVGGNSFGGHELVGKWSIFFGPSHPERNLGWIARVVEYKWAIQECGERDIAVVVEDTAQAHGHGVFW
jgi:hypothetical protein